MEFRDFADIALTTSHNSYLQSMPYGVTPTREEVDKEAMCSICHGDLVSPTKVSFISLVDTAVEHMPS